MYVCIEHNAKVWVLGTLCELWVSDLDNILACPRSCDLKYAWKMELAKGCVNLFHLYCGIKVVQDGYKSNQIIHHCDVMHIKTGLKTNLFFISWLHSDLLG